jgi:hypothetical protein
VPVDQTEGSEGAREKARPGLMHRCSWIKQEGARERGKNNVRDRCIGVHGSDRRERGSEGKIISRTDASVLVDRTGASERAREESRPGLMHRRQRIRQEGARENVLIANASSTGHQRKEALMDPKMGTVMPLMLQHNVGNYRLMMLPEGPPSSTSGFFVVYDVLLAVFGLGWIRVTTGTAYH